MPYLLGCIVSAIIGKAKAIMRMSVCVVTSLLIHRNAFCVSDLYREAEIRDNRKGR